MSFKRGDILYQYVYDEGTVHEYMCHVTKVFPVREYDRKAREYSEVPDIFGICYKKDTYPNYNYHVESDSINKRVCYKGGSPKIVVLSEKNFWRALDIFEQHFVKRVFYHDECKLNYSKKLKNIQGAKAYHND